MTEADQTNHTLPSRSPWRRDFPDVLIHTNVRIRDAHVDYLAAKSGDWGAGLRLSIDLLADSIVEQLDALFDRAPSRPYLLPITALETTGFNAIPDAMARVLASILGWPVSSGDVVQSNKVGHTRAKAFNRFVTPAEFTGPIERSVSYVLVDDHVGLGGTLANLKGYVEAQGGHVAAMTTLTESRDGRHLALRATTRDMLWERHGEDLDQLWREQFGHGLDCLSEVEATILCRELSVDAIRDRLAQAAVEARGRGLDPVFRGK